MSKYEGVPDRVKRMLYESYKHSMAQYDKKPLKFKDWLKKVESINLTEMFNN